MPVESQPAEAVVGQAPPQALGTSPAVSQPPTDLRLRLALGQLLADLEVEGLQSSNMRVLRKKLEERLRCGCLEDRGALLQEGVQLFLRRAQADEAAGRPRPVQVVDLTREAEVVVLDG